MRLVVLAAAAATASLCSACSGGSSDGTPPDEVDCSLVTDDDEFTIGLEKLGASGVFTFTIMAGDPAPPARGDNTWLVQITEGTTPVAGASVLVDPFMPAHQHGPQKGVNVTESTEAVGQYELSPVNLWMPGVWEITIDVTATDDAQDAALFRFCIPS